MFLFLYSYKWPWKTAKKKKKKKKVQLSATEVMPQFSTLDTQYSFALWTVCIFKSRNRERSSTKDSYSTDGTNSKVHFAQGKDNITCNEFNWPLQVHHMQAFSPTNLFSWYGEMDGREAWHIISLLGVWGNRISFLSEIKMMHHAGMNTFTAIDIHTLTNRKSYCHVGNGFIPGGQDWGVSFQLFKIWHLVVCQSDCWCWIKIFNG